MSTPPTSPADDERPPEDDPSAAAERPRSVAGAGIVGALLRAPRKFLGDQLTDVAGALTYFGMLSLFPALIALVSILGLAGPDATEPVLRSIESAPDASREILSDTVKGVGTTSGLVPFAIGVGVAVWSASGYVGAYGRASNRIYGVPEGRPFWKLRPAQLLITIAMLLMLSVGALGIVLTGPIAREVGAWFGLGSHSVDVWDVVKWPGILVVAAVTISVLMYFAPNVRPGGFRRVLIGASLTLAVWLLASFLLGLYFANFANYNKTYGALGGVIAFLFWLWVTNLAMLLGQVVNAELERGREVRAGRIPALTSALEPDLRAVPTTIQRGSPEAERATGEIPDTLARR